MKGILKRDFHFVDVSYEEKEGTVNLEEYDDTWYVSFYEGNTYDVIKVISDDRFNSGTAFLLFDSETSQALTVDSSFVKVVEDTYKSKEYWVE